MTHIVFWSEPDVITADDAHVTIGPGEIEGGPADGGKRIELAIHHGEDDWGRAHLTSEQAQDVIDRLIAARAALDLADGGAR